MPPPRPLLARLALVLVPAHDSYPLAVAAVVAAAVASRSSK